MAQYRATVGIDYPPNKRVEAGEIVSDLPGDSIKWLLEQGLIESTDKKSTLKEVVVETPKEEVPVIEEVIAEVPASEEGEAE
jgi:SOS-response transcriptional repressor LexA